MKCAPVLWTFQSLIIWCESNDSIAYEMIICCKTSHFPAVLSINLPFMNLYIILLYLCKCKSYPTLTLLGFIRSLWGGSVLNLGTKKHKDKYYDGIDNLEYPGCFAMTELHHGTFTVFYNFAVEAYYL